MNEFYETRNHRTAESRIYSSLGHAIIACLAFRSKRVAYSDCWSVSRVSDGATWHQLVWDGQQWVPCEGFGRRVYTPSGDAIRLERAAKRALELAEVA
jgi:hypothetical protein